MTATHFHDDCQQVIERRATGYGRNPNGDWRIDEDLMVETVGQGNLLTSIEDLARWDANFFEPVVGGPSTHDLLLRPGRLSDGTELPYCFGLTVSSYRSAQIVSHAGGTEGFLAEFIRFPAHRLSVACLSNGVPMNPTNLCLAIADLYLADHLGSADANPVPPSPLWSPPDADLVEVDDEGLVGRFRCAELEADYTIGDPETLHVYPPGGGRWPLTKVAPGVHTTTTGVRGEVVAADNGQAQQLRLGGGRAFGLALERVGD